MVWSCFYCVALWGCQTIGIVSSNSHFSIVHRIEAALYSHPQPTPELKHILVDKSLNPDIFQREAFCLWVAIGAEALQTILKSHTQKPILVLLTRKHMVNQLIHDEVATTHHNFNNISAIYLDQPIARQLNLIELIIPKKNHKNAIGILLGPASLRDVENIEANNQDKKITINSIYVNRFENPVGVLDTLLDEVNVLLAIPDNRIFNAKTTRGMLLTAFHKHVPLIGYSKTLVNNGALAALYSTNKQVAKQASEEIIQFIHQGKPLAKSSFAKDFAVAVNYQVARSLGIMVDSEAAIQYNLYEMENRHQNGGICTTKTDS